MMQTTQRLEAGRDSQDSQLLLQGPQQAIQPRLSEAGHQQVGMQAGLGVQAPSRQQVGFVQHQQQALAAPARILACQGGHNGVQEVEGGRSSQVRGIQHGQNQVSVLQPGVGENQGVLGEGEARLGRGKEGAGQRRADLV